MNELYTVPAGLDSSNTREAIRAAYPQMSAQHYDANGCSCHSFIDRTTGACVRIVEAPIGGMPAEIVGDAGLWLRIRAVVMRVKGQRDAAATDRG